ncbi:putative LRR receptor-like serine/threonine-protein kinase [Acorus calamus]|uniref:non-specific serine/threonine protein kinase n=1 Tax=Acorus calamus TaxID=4465 RepID=A0AAV9CQQ3_ACOCL|nr:putative LRR receptor-like serine/threonine-protein kinase [Acorus calamus]
MLVRFAALDNHLTGPIPKSLKNCISLERLRLERNQLVGNITNSFGVYPHLDYMGLSDNQFYGKLPPAWGENYKLTALYISGNRITGRIPSEFKKLINLRVLDLSSNLLTGEIPMQMSSMTSLYNLSLGDNMLSGMIPSTIGELRNLERLDLSKNRLSGPIPEEIGDCSKLISLKLSENNLNGSIPSQVGSLIYLQELLDLSHNALVGEIPSQLDKLTDLLVLNLSHNLPSGSIPSSFQYMLSLTTVDVSYNELEGPLPNNKAFYQAPAESFFQNKGLCGQAQGLIPCNSSLAKVHDGKGNHKILFYILFPIMGMILLLCALVKFGSIFYNKRKFIVEALGESNGDLFSIWNFDGRTVYEDIIIATEDFDDKYCIGGGGYGRVYKAELPTGQIVAVKKLIPVEGNEVVDERFFRSEIKALTEIRHRNIVRLFGFCSNVRCKFLVYEYMDNGSLADLLCDQEEVVVLDWTKRVNIVKDVSQALSYMHCDCVPPIIHRDIKSSNILLDSDSKACISDFGTARLLRPDSSNWTTIAGTYGYLPPVMTELWDSYPVKHSRQGVLTFVTRHDLVLIKWNNQTKVLHTNQSQVIP